VKGTLKDVVVAGVDCACHRYLDQVIGSTTCRFTHLSSRDGEQINEVCQNATQHDLAYGLVFTMSAVSADLVHLVLLYSTVK
jgi:hypothetical protein